MLKDLLPEFPLLSMWSPSWLFIVFWSFSTSDPFTVKGWSLHWGYVAALSLQHLHSSVCLPTPPFPGCLQIWSVSP